MGIGRISFAAALAVAALFSRTVFGQETVAPQTTGDDWCICSENGQACGYLHAVKKASGEKAAPVLFVQDWAINILDGDLLVRVQILCKDDAYFSPVRIVCTGEDDGPTNIDLGIERPVGGPSAGKLIGTVDDTKYEQDIPEHTVIDLALFEIVRTRPFEKDKVFEFNWLGAYGLSFIKAHKVTYVGREELEIEGKKQMLHKFEETGEGDLVSFWVSEDHQLVRMQADAGETEFVRTTKDKALSAFKAE